MAVVGLLLAAPAGGGWTPGALAAAPGSRPARGTLQAALDALPPGGRLAIPPGIYREHLRIDRPLTVVAAGPGATVLEGEGRGRVVEIGAPGVTVRGLTLRNSGSDLDAPDACIYVHERAASAVLAGNRLEECAFGIWINGAQGVRIEGNRVRGRVRPLVSDMGNGIHLWRVSEGIVRGNDVARVRDGVFLTVTTDSLVEGNLMRGVRFGLHYMYNDRNRIADNVACDSKVGLALMFSRRLEIVGNVALRNEEHGILFRSILDSRIEGNRAEGNGKGFILNDSSFNTLRGNLVRDNAIGVHITAGSEDNRVEGNNFIANPVQIRLSWRRPLVWQGERLGNHWSDYLGWDLDGDAVGDRSYYSASRMDLLVYRYPQLKLLAASPVVQLMQALESRFPVLRPAGVVDARPAMAPFALPAPAGVVRASLERCVAPEAPPGAAAPDVAQG